MDHVSRTGASVPPLTGTDSPRERLDYHTTRACGEIAMAAGVIRLVPFHFSLRNSDCPAQVYAEIQAVCPQVALPKDMRVFAPPPSAA